MNNKGGESTLIYNWQRMIMGIIRNIDTMHNRGKALT